MTSGDRRVMSGFPSLDKITGGFRPGSLNVISGRPGSGKTSFALNVAYNAAVKYNKRVLVISLESSKEELVNRFLSFASEDYLDTAKSLIYIDDDYFSCEEVKIRKRTEEIHPDLIIIDYLQLIVPLEEDYKRGITVVTSFLRQLATEYEVPVLVLQQLNRNFVSDKTTLTELYRAAPVVQDSDVFIILWREGYGSHREDPVFDVHLDVAKNKFGDSDVEVVVKFERVKWKFYEEE